VTATHYIAADDRSFCGQPGRGLTMTDDLDKVTCDLCKRTVARETALLDQLDQLEHNARALQAARKDLRNAYITVDNLDLGVSVLVALAVCDDAILKNREADDRCNEALDHLREFGERS
jgi:hypothetical protein